MSNFGELSGNFSRTMTKNFNKFLFPEQSSDDLKREREEKKRYLLRKLSFRPSVDELKNRKVRFKIKKKTNKIFINSSNKLP